MDLLNEQRLERRERILEGARELIAERGYEGLTMRDLATHCGVSVPTLYNQFGGKDALLARAVVDHFTSLLGRTAAGHGHARLVGVVALCADEMVRLPAYYRALLRAFMGVGDTAPLQLSLAGELAAELAIALDEMAARRQLAAWADGRVLAGQITSAVIAVSGAWAMGGLDDRGLRAAMRHAAAAMVLGVARGAARTALEREVRSAQKQLASAFAPPVRRTGSD